MKKQEVECVDCLEEGVTTYRPVQGGPRSRRCFTHRKAKKDRERARKAEKRVCDIYGLEPGQYDEIYIVQGGLCPICKKARGITKRLAVDHDHDLCDDHPKEVACPRCVRGLLCTTCNYVLLGRYDRAALVRAIEYLDDPPARRVLNPDGRTDHTDTAPMSPRETPTG